jgi:hypothetical protein
MPRSSSHDGGQQPDLLPEILLRSRRKIFSADGAAEKPHQEIGRLRVPTEFLHN